MIAAPRNVSLPGSLGPEPRWEPVLSGLIVDTMQRADSWKSTEDATTLIPVMRDAFAHATTFVVSLGVLNLAIPLMEDGFALEPLFDDDPATTWIEFTWPADADDPFIPGKLAMFGAMFHVRDGVVGGRMFCNVQGSRSIESIGFWLTGPTTFEIRTSTATGPGSREQDEQSLGRILKLIAVVFELIRHPRAVAKHHHEPRSKLYRDKGNLKRRPVPAYTEVLIHVTREVDDDVAGEQGHSGVRKRLHHVRPFSRTRLGKVELVCGHWRGDAKLGVVPQRAYRVVP